MASVNVSVRKQNGLAIPVQMKLKTTTVGGLKSMLVQDVGIRAGRQRLIFNGRAMESDDKTLSYYGVAANTTIDVELEEDFDVRFRGGRAIIGDFFYGVETESSSSSSSDSDCRTRSD